MTLFRWLLSNCHWGLLPHKWKTPLNSLKEMIFISLISANSFPTEWKWLLSHWLKTTLISLNEHNCYGMNATLMKWGQQLYHGMKTSVILLIEDNNYGMKTTIMEWRQLLWNKNNCYLIKWRQLLWNRTIVMKWWKLWGNEENCYGTKITVI